MVFLGSSYHPLSVACLQALVTHGADVVVALDDPVRKSGRRAIWSVWRRRGPSAVARRMAAVVISEARLFLRRIGVPLRRVGSIPELCETYRLESVRCADPNATVFTDFLRLRRIDLLVMANCRHILKRSSLSAPAFGTINVHPSLLPAFRGPDPIYWMVARRVRRGGVTVHQVDDGVDTGPIVLQESFEIEGPVDEATILRKSAALAGALLPRAAALILSGFTPVQQTGDSATYFPSSPRGASRL
jgi:methionyl-tRNA formyltransferase